MSRNETPFVMAVPSNSTEDSSEPTPLILKYVRPRPSRHRWLIIAAVALIGGASATWEYLQTGWSASTTIAIAAAVFSWLIVTVGILFLSQ
jgi:hypothetical protein